MPEDTLYEEIDEMEKQEVLKQLFLDNMVLQYHPLIGYVIRRRDELS